MFDLFRSRDKAVRILLGGLLLLVAFSMLTYLIPSYNSGGQSDEVVAEIGKDALTLQEVQRMVQSQLRGRQVPPEMIPHMVPQLIESMITERAIAYEAKRLGLQVSDNDVATTIRNLLPQLFPDGKFVGKEIYASVLAQQSVSIAEFEDDISRQILVNRLRDIVLQGVLVTPADVEKEYRRKNQKARIEYVKLTEDKYRAGVQASEQELRGYYSTHTALYQVPEKHSLAILVLDQAKLAQSLAPSDAELQRMYDQNKERFRTPERVKVRHILLKTTGKPAGEEPAIKAKTENLLKQIKSGGNFAELAKKNSEDPGSADKGGELPDWVVRGQTVPEFEKTAFTLKPGETSDVVKTQYGFHIIQVLKKEDAHLQPFDEAKAQLATEWRNQRSGDQVQRAMDKAQAALQKDPQHPDKVAADFNMQVLRADKVSPGDPLPEIGANRDFDDSVASLKKGEVSQPVAVTGNKIALAVVTDIQPAHPATFEEVQNQVRDTVVAQKLNQLVIDRSAELYQKAVSMGGDLKKAAQSMGLEAKTSDDFDRQGAVEGLGQATYISEAFSKPVGSLVGPVMLPQVRAVFRIVSRTEADPAMLAGQSKAIRDDLKTRKARERNALFEDGLRQSLINEGKIKIHQDVVSRLAANYRG